MKLDIRVNSCIMMHLCAIYNPHRMQIKVCSA